MTGHRHTWIGVGGCNENPGVWSIRATHPTRGGNGQGMAYHHRCETCGAHRECTDYQMPDGSWSLGKVKITSQDDYEGDQ